MSDMPGSKRKFSLEAEDLNDAIAQMFVGALRKGITDGFETAVQATHQDSSNAAVHWMVGITGASRPSSRALGGHSYLRGVRAGKGSKHGIAPKHPWVGYRGDQRSITGEAIAVGDKVLAREVNQIIGKYVRGQTPPLGFFFYNAFADMENYAGRAHLEEAGKAGVARAIASFDREISLGNVRRYARR